MIIINFKNYVIGKRALKLARLIERYLPEAIVAVSAPEIRMIVRKTGLKVYAQHVDYFEKKNTTGFIIPEDVKLAGAVGTLLNHSEHRIVEKEINETIKRCKKIKLKVVLCVQNLEEVRKYKGLKPYAIALEDKKLIGTGRSITEYRKDEVLKFARLLSGSGVRAICGAGIGTREDVVVAKKLGCKGVLIASAIAKARNSTKLLEELGKI